MGEAAVGEEIPPLPQIRTEDKGKATAEGVTHPNGTGGEGTSGLKDEAGKEGTARKPGQCYPKSKVVPKLQIKSTRFRENVQYLKDHALIGKFIGFWPNEKALSWWINTTWKPQGHYDLQLGAKGFFTVVFFNPEDRVRIFDNGPYFFHSAGLYLRIWKDRFNPDTENMTIAPVWLRLYSLPTEYWKEEILTDIGNALGEFVKISEQTKQVRYVSYARLCVYLDISKDLPEAIELTHDDEEWVQTIDYEQLPFRCRRCHEHGHLFRYCPLNTQAGKSEIEGDGKDAEGFVRVTNRKRAAKKPSGPETKKKLQTHNSFAALQEESTVVETPGGHPSPELDKDGPVAQPMEEPNREILMEEVATTAAETEVEDMILGELDLDGLEAAFASNRPKDITPQQVNLLEKAIIITKTTNCLGVATGPPKETDGKRRGKIDKKGRPTNIQRIQRIGQKLIDSGQYPTIVAALALKPQ